MAPILSSAGQAPGVGILGSPPRAPARSPPSNLFTRARRGAFSEVRHGDPQQRMRVRPHNLYCLLLRARLCHSTTPAPRCRAWRLSPVDQLPQLWLRQSPTYGLADGKVQATFVIAREVSPTSSVKENYNESEARRFR